MPGQLIIEAVALFMLVAILVVYVVPLGLSIVEQAASEGVKNKYITDDDKEMIASTLSKLRVLFSNFPFLAFIIGILALVVYAIKIKYFEYGYERV